VPTSKGEGREGEKGRKGMGRRREEGKWSGRGEGVVVCWYTKIPNRYPISSNTDIDTDVGILNTENTENPVQYSPSGAVQCAALPSKLVNLISLTGR